MLYENKKTLTSLPSAQSGQRLFIPFLERIAVKLAEFIMSISLLVLEAQWASSNLTILET